MRGRYSIIGLDPDLVWRTVAGTPRSIAGAPARPTALRPATRRPLQRCARSSLESRIELPDVLPPMAAGFPGYLGYDMVRLMEELPQPNPDPIGLPDAVLVRPTIVVVFDAVKDAITVVTPVRPQNSIAADTAFARAETPLGDHRCARRTAAHSPPTLQAGR